MAGMAGTTEVEDEEDVDNAGIGSTASPSAEILETLSLILLITES